MRKSKSKNKFSDSVKSAKKDGKSSAHAIGAALSKMGDQQGGKKFVPFKRR